MQPGWCVNCEDELCVGSRQAAAKPLPPWPASSQDAHPGFFGKRGAAAGSDDPSPSAHAGIPSAAQSGGSGQGCGSENRPQPSQPGGHHVPQHVRGKAPSGRRPLAPLQPPRGSQHQPGGQSQPCKQQPTTQPAPAAAAAGGENGGVERGVVPQDSLNEGQRTAVQRCAPLHCTVSPLLPAPCTADRLHAFHAAAVIGAYRMTLYFTNQQVCCCPWSRHCPAEAAG